MKYTFVNIFNFLNNIFGAVFSDPLRALFIFILNSMVSSAFLEVYFKGNSDHQYTFLFKGLYHFHLDQGFKAMPVCIFSQWNRLCSTLPG